MFYSILHQLFIHSLILKAIRRVQWSVNRFTLQSVIILKSIHLFRLPCDDEYINGYLNMIV